MSNQEASQGLRSVWLSLRTKARIQPSIQTQRMNGGHCLPVSSSLHNAISPLPAIYALLLTANHQPPMPGFPRRRFFTTPRRIRLGKWCEYLVLRSAGTTLESTNRCRSKLQVISLPCDSAKAPESNLSLVPVVPVLDENPTVSNAPSPAPDQTLCALLDSMPRNSTLLTSIPVQDLGMCKYICLRPGHQLSRGVSTVPAQFERTVLLPKLLRREVDEVTQKKFCIDWKQQLRLASALVWAVLHLCDSPWLRESLKEDDIHFFLRDDQGANSPVLSLHPYVTHNFCSSPSTTDPPNDQDSMGLQFPSNQIQHIMLFTLAIRLIEIGLNKPFSRLQQKFQNATTTPPNAPQSGPPIASDSPTTTCDDYKIAQLQIDKLGLKMGKFYAGAVESCLRFGSLERVPMNTFENSSFLKTYFDAVVAPIQAIMELRLNM